MRSLIVLVSLTALDLGHAGVARHRPDDQPGSDPSWCSSVITGLIIPLLILVIAPIALLIAVAHVLNRLSTDTEIIVMNSAGMSPGFFCSAPS